MDEDKVKNFAHQNEDSNEVGNAVEPEVVSGEGEQVQQLPSIRTKNPLVSEQQNSPKSPEHDPYAPPQVVKRLILTPEENEENIKKEIQAIQIYRRRGLRDAPADSYQLSQVYGFQSHKRSNIHYIEENLILSSIGNVILIQNINDGETKYVQGVREGSIGCIAVHPSKTLIAVGEICDIEPNIYIYQYPAMKIIKILSGAAVRGFADLSFNQNGSKLASLATEPDYMLTIWDWDENLILLKSKAFSQDVFRVSFSPDNDGILTTSGMGHIKFWRMSSTFTGLKLQGYLGKFGATELTDIASFVQLPDGKVLSSTETGNLLLWDGGMIKCEIGLKGKKPCHQGKIEVILLGEGEVITAGDDGFVKIWDLETIDNADVATANGSEVSSASVPSFFEMESMDEILISKDVKIKCLIRNPTNHLEFIIQDQQGQLIKLDLSKRFTENIYSFHSGSVNGASSSPSLHTMATLGIDGNLRIYDYISKKIILKTRYSQGGTFLTYLPLNVDSSGSTLFAGFVDGLIRFITIAGKKSMVLQYVIKPSKSAITSCAFSADGSKLAVSSADKSIFLFHLNVKADEKGNTFPFTNEKVKIAPLGYFIVSSPATSLSFAPEDEVIAIIKGKRAAYHKKLLVTTEDGSFYSAHIQNEGGYDSSISYELDPSLVNLKNWNLKVPEKLNTQQQKLDDQIEGENNGGRTKSKSLLSSQNGLSFSLNSLRKQKGLNIISTSRFFSVLALNHGYFITGVENQDDEVEIRLCNYKKPEFSLLLGIVNERITSLSFDHPKKRLLIGTKRGACTIISFKQQLLPFDIRDADACPESHESYADYVKRFEERIQRTLKSLQKENPTIDISNPSPYTEVDGQQWNGNLHDVNSRITAFCSSFDGSHYISTSTDGGIFIWKSLLENVQEELPTNNDLSGQLKKISQPEDIVDSGAYSIQEEKLKAAKDRELEAAEAKKRIVRNQIDDLRKEYSLIIAQLESKGSDTSRSDIAVDPYLKRDSELEAERKIEILLKELAWQAEKDTIGSEKLMKKYLRPLKHERIEISAFKKKASVATFRTLAINQQIQSALQIELDEINTKQDAQNDSTKAATKDVNTNTVQQNISKKSTPKKPQNIANKLEARKQLRAERAAMWKILMDSKPDEKYEDPADVAAIRYAMSHMGDYKLKSANNYIVPESERVDADKKKRQILILNESIKNLKEQFNEKVFRLRNRKVNLVNQFTISNQKLKEINQKLRILNIKLDNSISYQPMLEPGIFPENREIVTQEDIENLRNEDILAASAETRKGGDDMGFGTGVAAGSKEAPKPKSATPQQDKSQTELNENANPSIKSIKSVETELSLRESVRKTKLIFEKDSILQNLENQVKEFDDALELLFNERILLSVDLKFADIKLLLFFREWMLLKEFEQTDNILADKLNTKKGEKKDIEIKIDEYREKLSSKKAEIESIIHKEKEIHDEYRKLIGDNSKSEEYLTKVFKRKIKRVKKKAKTEGDEEEEEEEEEDDDDLSSYNSDENEESVEFEEVKPHDCDPAIWENVLEIRERRLDLEEVLIDVQKAVELVKKEHDSLLKKEKIIDIAMKNAESEIEDFQTLKQRKLNELDVIVPLRFTQLQYLVNGEVPSDLSPSLVFFNEGLSQLKRRIKELHQEKNDIKKQHRELKKLHVNFNKSKNEKEQRVAELSAKTRDVQMLKFGQIVDLEKLEKLGANKVPDEVKEKLQKEELQRVKEVIDMEAKIRAEKERMMEVVKTNTEYLETIVDLQKQKSSLEKALNFSQNSLTSELSGPNQKEIEEKEKLIALVQNQASQIEAIKLEIENLIRKPTTKTFLKFSSNLANAQKKPLPPLTASAGVERIVEEEDSVAFDEKSVASVAAE